MNKYKTTALILLSVLSIALFFYNGNSQYLRERSADKVWFELLPTLREVVKKGDFLSYPKNEDVQTTANETWSAYKDSFVRHVDILNSNNAPLMRSSYILKTQFDEVDGKHKITFFISEKNTGELVEKKEILSEPIKTKSLIPALIAIVLCFTTMSPIISLLISIWIGSSLHNNSLLLGLEQCVSRYLPHGVTGNSFNIIIFLFIIHFLLRLLAYSGSTKDLNDNRSGFFRFIPLALMTVHPYLFSSVGAWWFNITSKRSSRFLRSSFIAHSLSLITSSLFIASPYMVFLLLTMNTQVSGFSFNIGIKNMFLYTLPFKFFSVSLLLVTVWYMLFDKKFVAVEDLSKPLDHSIFKNKHMVKPTSSITLYISGIIFAGIFVAGIFTNSLKSRGTPLTYLSNTNASFSLVFAVLVAAVITLIIVFKKHLINVQDSIYVFKKALKESIPFIVLIILASAFAQVLVDIGTPHCLMSLFKTDTETMLPLASFLITSLIGIFMGSSIVTISVLSPLLIPIAGQTGSISDIIMTMAAIIEGGMVGELVSPYSPTSIMVSSVFRLNTSRHVAYQISYVGIAFILAAFIGFLLAATNVPLWLNYIVICLVSFALMFRKNKKP